MKKNIQKYMVLALLIVIAACGGIGIGSLAQGSGGREAGRAGEKAAGRDGKAPAEAEMPGFVEEGQSYAFLEFKRGKEPVLLVTDGTYGYNGLEASFSSEVYGKDGEGNWQRMAVIAGSGTAYPLRYDKRGIYVTGAHFAVYYTVDWERMQLAAEEYASESFDESGKASYVYAERGEAEQAAEDNRHLIALFDRYEKALLVDFQKKE